AAMQGTTNAGSENFVSNFLGKASRLKDSDKSAIGFSRLVNQSAIINTNHLKKLLYIKTNNNISVDASVNVYVTVLEDWVDPKNAMDSIGLRGSATGACYIPYLDSTASRQIVCQDYDIWDSSDIALAGSETVDSDRYSAGTKNAVTGVVANSTSNVLTMVPHLGLNEITAFPDWTNEGILTDTSLEKNKDLLLFDWRAKSLAQPTFACCDVESIEELGKNASAVDIDEYAASFISNNFVHGKDNASYILDADLSTLIAANDVNVGGEKSYVADKGTYIHSIEDVFKWQVDNGSSTTDSPKLFSKWDSNSNSNLVLFSNSLTTLKTSDRVSIINSRYTKVPWFTWEGLSLPKDPTPKPREGFTRLHLTKNAITMLVSIIRTASLLINGMVINHELDSIGTDKVNDVITTKTIYNAWYNTNEFLRQLSELKLSSILNPAISSDFPSYTVTMPSWLEVLQQANNIKVKQFFRSKLCTETQLKKIIGDTLGKEEITNNYPPTISVFNGYATISKDDVESVPGGTLKANNITFVARNKEEYPTKTGTTYAEDMYNYTLSTTAATTKASAPGNNQLLRGFVRPVMWDPSGSYAHHALIPAELRGKKLGFDWDKLAYISSDGTLKNNGNALQKAALNYKTNNNSFRESGRLMFCTPYIPVGNIAIANPQRTATTDTYVGRELYRHQGIDGSDLRNAGATAYDKAYKLQYGTVTAHTDVSESIIYKVVTATDNIKCGPPIKGDTATVLQTNIPVTTVANGLTGYHLPKGIGYSDDGTTKRMDLAHNQRRLSMHTVVKGHSTQGGKAIYQTNNNMGIGMLAWSDLHSKLVDTGDGYEFSSLDSN
ncbi:MAG: hypothetical protein HN879_02755, partial [Flavobacteriaceae bacterium]|nr:hypothetical protein [Flavobacteriaceae bacterium]